MNEEKAKLKQNRESSSETLTQETTDSVNQRLSQLQPDTDNDITSDIGYDSEPVFTCDVCGKSFTNEVSLRYHKLRSHKISAKQKEERGEKGGRPSTPTREAKTYTPSEPILEEVSPDALPDELMYLDEKILKPHGIRDREVIIRAMKLRDPEDLVELQRALEDVGISRGRQRRIIRDYARYLGVRIPKILVEKLKPPNEYVEPPEWSGYSWRRPRYEDEFEEGQKQQSQEKGLLDLLIRWEELKLRQQSIQTNNPSSDNSRLDMLEEELKEKTRKI